jgi:transcriptional regulator with XRE-family HTH domain
VKTRTVPKWPIDSDEIRRLARAGGITIATLAARAGIERTTMSKYLTGHREIGLDEVAVLAHELGRAARLTLTVEDITAKPCGICGTVRHKAAA